MANSVLFVCTANMCRSPMAEVLFRQKILDKGNPEWRIASAGTWASKGQAAAQHVLTVLEERGLDAREHRSQPVTRHLLENFNLILVMEQGHKEALQVEFPGLVSKIHLLSEMVGTRRDIYDPMGSPLLDFRDTAREIDDYLRRGFERITYLAGVKQI